LDRDGLLTTFLSSASLALASEDEERLNERPEGTFGSTGRLTDRET
jgi:hypothetical protein